MLAVSLPLALHVHAQVGEHLRSSFAGPHADYVGVALLAALSWIGISGPGEAALIAAGIAAARHNVDIVGVIGVAWLGATLGGSAGWLIGLKGGRALVSMPGPLRSLRLRLLRHGDNVYARRGWLAVYLAPAWMAGVSRMHARRFLPANALAALVWALLIGLGAYLAGPSVAEVLSDLGTVGLVAVIVLALIALVVRRLLGRRGLRPDGPSGP